MSEELNREWEKKSEEIAVLEGRTEPKKQWNPWVKFIIWCILLAPIHAAVRGLVVYTTGEKWLGFLCQLIVSFMIGVVLSNRILIKKQV